MVIKISKGDRWRRNSKIPETEDNPKRTIGR